MPEKNSNLADDDKKKNSSGDSKPPQKRGTQRRRPTFRKRRSGHYNVNKKRDDEANPEEKSSSPGEKPQVKTHSRTQNKTPRLVPSNKSVSVVIPLYNEEESLKELSYKLYQVLDGMNCNYEVIFIDDGSTDSSYKKIQEINSKNSRFHCIKFRRNYGKSAALAAGFKEAKGDIVITMDADLQDDPDEIPSLIQKLNEGYDLVSGWKKVRYDPFIKKHTSKFFNYVTSKVSGIRLHDFNCGLKAYKKDVVKNVQIYGEMHRYVPALAYMMGFKVTEKPVKHHARKFGVTKFGPSRFLNGFLDLMTVAFTTKFMSRPLHLFGILGILSFICGFLIMAYLTVMKYAANMSISDRPLFLVGILFTIVGVQFLTLGLIAEMITKTTSREADYLIETKI
jgi:glycosyltransferase involved in cell wall biosynthesis